MRQRHGDLFGPQFFESLLRLTVKLDLGRCSGRARDLDVAPSNAATLARAQGLHGGFLRRKPGRIVFNGPSFRLTVGNLTRREKSVDEPLAVALERLFEAWDFDQINAYS